MADAGWTISKDVSAVGDCAIVVSCIWIAGEPVNHFQLMDDCVHGVAILSIGLIGWVEGNSRVKCLFCCVNVAQGKLSLKKSFVNAGELAIQSYSSFAVFYSEFVLLQCNIGGSPIRQNLLTWLYVYSKGLNGQLDGKYATYCKPTCRA